MKEIFGWMPQQNKDGLERLIAKHNVKPVIEIGSFLGHSAAWFATRVDHVWCIDPFEETATEDDSNNMVATLRDLGLSKNYLEAFQANMVEAGVWSKITPIVGKSQRVFLKVPLVDLVYVDGDHSYEACFRDLVLYRVLARKVICGDDYHLNPQGEPYFPGVRRAVDEAFPEHGSDYTFWWKEFV